MYDCPRCGGGPIEVMLSRPVVGSGHGPESPAARRAPGRRLGRCQQCAALLEQDVDERGGPLGVWRAHSGG